MYRTSNGNFKRRDYRLHELLDGHTQRKTLFMIGWEYDEDVQAFALVNAQGSAWYFSQPADLTIR